MTFCNNCGKSVQGASFCPDCGTAINQVTPDLTNPAPPAAFQDSAVVQPVEQPTKPKKTGVIVAAVAGAAVVVAAGAFLLGTSGPTPLQEAHDTCFPNLSIGNGASIDDDGKGMFIDMEGEEEYSGASYFDIVCVLAVLDVPPSVQSQMDNTTSLMGVQNASWDGLSASWTYHPDRGLDINFSMD